MHTRPQRHWLLASLLLVIVTACGVAGGPSPETPSPLSAKPGLTLSTDPVVTSVHARFDAFNEEGAWLGFHKKGGEGAAHDNDPWWEKYDNHNQGIVRRPGPGTPYFVVTRSVEPPSSSSVMIVQMGSRNVTGERLRSNRLRKGSHTDYVAPRVEDKVLHHFVVPPPAAGQNHDYVYKHPGSMQIVDDIVPIPLEKGRHSGDPRARIIFMDLRPLPEVPTFIRMPSPTGVGPLYSVDLSHDAGILGMTKLPAPDGRILMAFTWGHNEEVEFWLSNVTDLRKLGTDLPPEEGGGQGRFELQCTWHHASANALEGYWPVKTGSWSNPGNGCYQGLNFVREGIEGPLHLVGFRHTNSATPGPNTHGHNEARLYRVDLLFDTSVGEPTRRPLREVRLKELSSKTFSAKPIGTYSDIQANFAAGTSLYISPSGEMLAYACEHWSDGPGDTFKFAEYRHRDVFAVDSPAYAPRIDVGGGPDGYQVDEGDSIVLDGRGTAPPVAEAWLELYKHSDWAGDRVMFDVVDRDLKDWSDFRRIEDTDYSSGFNNEASSLRWFAPPGGTFTLWEKDDYKGDNLIVRGTGKPESLGHLSVYDLNDKLSSLQFTGPSAGVVERMLWSIKTSPSFGHLSSADTATPGYHAVEGTPDSQELVECTAWSDLFAHAGTKASSTATVPIVVRNVPPDVRIDAVERRAGGAGGGGPGQVRGQEYVLRGSFTDAGVLDTHTAVVDWGDGHSNSSAESIFQMEDCVGGVTGTVVVPHVYRAVGTYRVLLTVSDDDGGTTTATFDLFVPDTEPPVVTATLKRSLLWPARNGLMPAMLSATATDDFDPNPVITVEIWSDEPNGTPPFSPDARGATHAASLCLRAQRALPGDGRVYLVLVRATDRAIEGTGGNTSRAVCLSSIVPICPIGSWITGARAQAAAAEAYGLEHDAAPPGFVLLHSFTIP